MPSSPAALPPAPPPAHPRTQPGTRIRPALHFPCLYLPPSQINLFLVPRDGWSPANALLLSSPFLVMRPHCALQPEIPLSPKPLFCRAPVASSLAIAPFVALVIPTPHPLPYPLPATGADASIALRPFSSPASGGASPGQHPRLRDTVTVSSRIAVLVEEGAVVGQRGQATEAERGTSRRKCAGEVGAKWMPAQTHSNHD